MVVSKSRENKLARLHVKGNKARIRLLLNLCAEKRGVVICSRMMTMLQYVFGASNKDTKHHLVESPC